MSQQRAGCRIVAGIGGHHRGGQRTTKGGAGRRARETDTTTSSIHSLSPVYAPVSFTVLFSVPGLRVRGQRTLSHKLCRLKWCGQGATAELTAVLVVASPSAKSGSGVRGRWSVAPKAAGSVNSIASTSPPPRALREPKGAVATLALMVSNSILRPLAQPQIRANASKSSDCIQPTTRKRPLSDM